MLLCLCWQSYANVAKPIPLGFLADREAPPKWCPFSPVCFKLGIRTPKKCGFLLPPFKPTWKKWYRASKKDSQIPFLDSFRFTPFWSLKRLHLKEAPLRAALVQEGQHRLSWGGWAQTLVFSSVSLWTSFTGKQQKLSLFLFGESTLLEWGTPFQRKPNQVQGFLHLPFGNLQWQF